MDVAFADNSPLGQYLAELDTLDASSSTSLAAQLKQDDSERQSTEKAATRRWDGNQPPQSRTQKHATSAWRCMKKSAQRLALEQLLRFLDSETDVRDAVLEAAGMGGEWLPSVRCWLFLVVPTAVPSVNSVSLLAAVMVAVSALTWTHEALTVPRLLLLCLLSAAALELSYQTLVAYYSLICRRLITRIRGNSLARGELQQAFTRCLDIVKRSEIVARGYTLGRVLPPIGRLEEASNARAPQFHVQCRRLRLRLRDANDALEQASRAVAAKAALPTAVALPSAVKDDLDSVAPSLLVSALMKRHELTRILLESALRDTLVNELAHLAREADDSVHDSFTRVLSQQTHTYEVLTQLMVSWSQELDRWCTRLLRFDSEPDEKNEELSQGASATAAVRVPREVTAVGQALSEFQTSCDTLAALAVASQHDIVDCIAASASSATSESECVDFDQAHWHGKLQRSREQIAKLIQQLTYDWERLERVADEAKSGRRTEGPDASQQTTEERLVCESQAEELRDQQQARGTSQQDAERDYLLVFTATSTGEKDFDLQELLRQQRQDEEQRLQSAAAPIPSFMGELQNVLELRTALPSAPVLVKRIGDEASSLSSQSQSQQQPQPQSEPVAPRAVDLQQLLQSRFTAQLQEESFGLSSGEEDDE